MVPRPPRRNLRSRRSSGCSSSSSTSSSSGSHILPPLITMVVPPPRIPEEGSHHQCQGESCDEEGGAHGPGQSWVVVIILSSTIPASCSMSARESLLHLTLHRPKQPRWSSRRALDTHARSYCTYEDEPVSQISHTYASHISDYE